MERIDLYKDLYTKTEKTIIRGDSIPDGSFALIVFACIFNSHGEMLIQQRSFSKSGWPGLWDVSAGGWAMAGETSLDAVKREVVEELGIDIPKSNFTKLLTIHYPSSLHDIYAVKYDINISDLSLQTDEVASVKWASKDAIISMIDRNEFIPVYRDFISLLFDMQHSQGIIES